MKANPVVVALDLPTAEDAIRMARTVAPAVGAFKVGLGLLMGPGPAVTKVVSSLDRPVFVDAKLHDIPSTVHRAAEQVGRLGARYLTVHALGGQEMLTAAVEGLESGAGGRDAGVLAVTVLTSTAPSSLAKVGIPASVGKQTAKLAKLAQLSRCEGVVCPGTQLGVVAESAPDLLRAVPGIRPEAAEPADQVHIMTPGEAVARGADLIIVGRPITGASDPLKAAEAIAEEARTAVASH
ncbi:MAG: orotidine-5'-phosphate decarboxylase [Acidimicrobiia bacterium]